MGALAKSSELDFCENAKQSHKIWKDLFLKKNEYHIAH